RTLSLSSILVFAHHRDPPPFPTRRSSDLEKVSGVRSAAGEINHEVVLSVLELAFRELREQVAIACLARTLRALRRVRFRERAGRDRKSTRLKSSHVKISYAVFCLKKNKER